MTTNCADPVRLIMGFAIAVAAAVSTNFGAPAADDDGIKLASHRAIYDLKLAHSRGRRALTSAQGRIVYDFSGNACEGYALQFRQVTELDNGEGKVVMSDLRSTTWEDGAGTVYRFNFQNYLSERLVDLVDGRAERRSEDIAVSLAKPANKRFELEKAIVFPTEQIRRIVAAARAGKTLLEMPLYDGSESGERIYSTLTVIGQPIRPDQRKPDDAAAGQPLLEGMRRWPVTISYFDRAKQGGEQTPAYAIKFELYENGVSRALLLDYGNFAITGTMTSLEMKETKPCP